MRIIDIVSDKIQEIIDELYKDDKCKPTFILSMMYRNNNSEFLLTIIHSDKPTWIDYRQSEIINLHTDLENLIETLYNRTT